MLYNIIQIQITNKLFSNYRREKILRKKRKYGLMMISELLDG